MSESKIVERIYAAGLTDKGSVRSMNQDFVYVSMEPVGVLPNLFIVADGMGGHKAGDLASKEAVRFFVGDVKEHSQNAASIIDLMKTALERTNRYIFYMSEESEDFRGMGTTFVVCTIVGYTMYCLNVGDSRLYTVSRAGEDKNGVSPVLLRQVTEDHSLVEMMLRMGVIDEEMAKNHPNKNVITRAIGIDEMVEIDVFTEDVHNLKSILLCSDGLTNMVSDPALLQILTNGDTTENRCGELIHRANDNGGKDNISAVLIDLREEEKGNA